VGCGHRHKQLSGSEYQSIMASFTITQRDPVTGVTKSREIGGSNPAFIIVDVGSTHCASLELAKRLIDVSKIAGVDCVKFQKRCTQALLTREGRERKYDSPHAMAPTYGEHRDVMEFSFQEFKELQSYAIRQGLFFTASAWDPPSLEFLISLDVPFIKIASADLTNLPLLQLIAQTKKPVVMSTGMASLDDVIRARKLFGQHRTPLAILQCTSSYPTPASHVHLSVIKAYQKEFPDCVIGFSGHSEGYHIALGAVALGAKVLEKHLTMNQEAKGSDHKSALNPSQLGHFVTNTRQMEKAIGLPNKRVQNSEHGCIRKLCKSITSTCVIPSGTVITADMITTKSPGNGIPASSYYNVLGQKAVRDIEDDSTVMMCDIGQ